jgi:predicted transcriptional regulator
MTNEHILKVGIAPMEQFKARTMAIARGEYKPSPDEPKIWFSSPESFAQVLSGKNQALIAKTNPASLTELSETSGPIRRGAVPDYSALIARFMLGSSEL